jgi:ribosomal protein L14
MINKGVAIIGTWDMPVGNRIYGPIYFEARLTKYIKIAMLAEGSF